MANTVAGHPIAAVIRASSTQRPSSRFFRSASAQRAYDLYEPLQLQELCKRRILCKLGLHRLSALDVVLLPRRIRAFLKRIPADYFAKPDNFGWLHYLNHFTLRNIHVAEFLLDRRMYTIKMVSSTFVMPSVVVEAWKTLRHPNVMQYIVSVRESPPWRVYHVFQGTSISLRVCDELKICRKLIIPEKLLWDVVEKILEGLIYVHHEKKLVYNNFNLDHVYYAADGMEIILENPLLHDFPNLASQDQRSSTHYRPPPQTALSDEIEILQHAAPEPSPALFLIESERRAVQNLGSIMDKLSLPADSSNVFVRTTHARRSESNAAQRAVREMHYSTRLVSLIESMCEARQNPKSLTFLEIKSIARDARQAVQMALMERSPMTIAEYLRPEDGPVPLIRRHMAPWTDRTDDDAN